MTNESAMKFSSEMRARAVRMAQDHGREPPSRWAAISAGAAKVGCTAETLRLWLEKAECDSADGGRGGDVEARLKALERERRELRQANEILRKASAYFALAGPGRRHKP